MSDPVINLYNQDCLEAMKQMKDNQYDLAIVDPPYGIGKTWLKRKRKKFKNTYKNEKTPSIKYFTELNRISKHYIIWGANFYNFGWPTKNVIIWDKICKWEKDRKAESEIAITNINSRPISIFRFQWSGGRKGIETGIKIIHPHQKPVALYKWLLEKYAKEGYKILDTHGGSMSIAIACWDLGFDLDLYELDKDYFEAGKNRLEEHKKQLFLFR